ncbi:MAG: tRNA pseudouridine(55) synthase TruB [Patescibacteria group bacterium]|nr:tRNA pseudouridine(55) synthase TruB [Patescibacteria group bacterium]
MKNILALYKPKGPTSSKFIQEIKKKSGVAKIGHGGTLDPLASGVLVVGIDAGTRLLNSPEFKEKEYLAKIKLGAYSSTDDEEGEKTRVEVSRRPGADEVEKAAEKFAGAIEQVPPIWSAVKVSGREAYKLARRGRRVELKPRAVEIKEIEVINYSWPFLSLRVVTGPGVYVRTLARDIGCELGTGGYLADLERIRVGYFRKENAISATEAVSKLKKKEEDWYTASVMITIDEFKKAQIKIGKVLAAEKVPETDKLLKLVFDVGESEPRQILAGIAEYFPEPAVLIGREMPVLLNIEPKKLKGLTSYGMLIAADADGQPILLHPERGVPPGSEVR